LFNFEKYTLSNVISEVRKTELQQLVKSCRFAIDAIKSPVEFNPVNSQEVASDWRVSHNIGGSPGADDMLYPDGKASGLFTLFQNYPNPFADLTNIFYKLNVQADIELAVFSISGQKIITLEKAIKPAGYYKVEWDGSSRYNGRVPDGIYFYRLAVRSTSGSDILTGKMMLIR